MNIRIKPQLIISMLIATISSTSMHAAEIHDAIQLKQTETVKAMLKSNPSLKSTRTDKGMTPLHQAAVSDAGEIAAILIGMGADPSALTLNGTSPIQIAIRNESINVFRELITRTTVIYNTPALNPETLVGKKALNSGEFTKAGNMAAQLLRDDPGNENINFANGLIHSALAQYSHAGMAFERVLQINANNDRARLELARAYIGNKQLSLAKEQLMIVRSHRPPQGLEKRLDKTYLYLKKNIKRWTMTGRIDAGVFQDDNVNIGPNSTVIDIKPVVIGSTRVETFALSKESQASDSTGYSAILSLSGIYDAGEKGNWMLTSDAAYYQSFLEKEFSQYENIYGLITAGIRKSTSKTILDLKMTGTHITSGDDPLVNMYGINPSYMQSISPSGKTYLSSSFIAEIRDYDKLDYRDSTYFELSETLKSYKGKARHCLSAGATIAMEDTESDVYKYFEFGINLSADFNLPWKSSLHTDVSYAFSEYDEPEALAPEVRSDDELVYTIGLSKMINSHSGIDINHQFTDNNSSFNLYEYDRNITTLTIYVAY